MTYSTAPITIRPGYADDTLAVSRLASLDSATNDPPAPLLLAEVDGVLRAALSLRDGSAISDPFFPSAALVALLRAHGSTTAAPRPGRSWRRRRVGPRRAITSVGRPPSVSLSRSER